MIDKHLMEQVEDVLGRLSVPVTVIDKDPDSMLYSSAYGRDMADGVCHEENGRLFLPVTQPPLVLSCEAELPGAADILMLAAALTTSLGNGASRPETSYDVYRKILLGELTGSELEALGHEHQLPTDLERCVLVFHIVQTDHIKAYELLRDLTPLQEKDALIDMDRHTAVLIKDMSDVESMDEIV